MINGEAKSVVAKDRGALLAKVNTRNAYHKRVLDCRIHLTSNVRVTSPHTRTHRCGRKVTLDWHVKKYIRTTRLQDPKVGTEAKFRFVQP